MPDDQMPLDEFNAVDAASATAIVDVWAAVGHWSAAIVAARPYDTVDDLAERADALAREWTRADLDTALAHHPRIGEKPQGSGAEARASRGEQASMTDAADDVAAAISAGNAAYEERFGRVFLIRAAGRSPEEMRSELQRRLSNDDDHEAAEALEQLRQIALLRLRGAVGDQEPYGRMTP